MIKKACPIVISKRNSVNKILVFRHPLAGIQLVKGTIEPNEPADAAAIREMEEESGVIVSIDQYAGSLVLEYLNEEWEIFLVKPKKVLPDTWKFFTADDGGREFLFFWMNLDEFFLNEEIDERFKIVVSYLNEKLTLY